MRHVNSLKYMGFTVLKRNHMSLCIKMSCLEECMSKYGNARVWRACSQVFDYLPLAAVRNDTRVIFVFMVLYTRLLMDLFYVFMQAFPLKFIRSIK
jgi:hypothetical protein